MELGQLEQVTTAEDIYRSPATLFTASFIGAGSFVPAEVVAVEDDVARVRVAAQESKQSMPESSQGARHGFCSALRNWS